MTQFCIEMKLQSGVQLVQYVISSICNIDNKKVHVSIYIAVLTYAAVFCPFNTYQKDYKYITPFVKIAI